MDKTKKPLDQQNAQNGNEIIQDQPLAVCSPEFAEGCRDIEDDDTEA